ncbi:MAG: rhomboid family intramembrane serine protease [Nanoarchaeota archaeon]|nr:rhomboid family intramembrane serine protease [Nanoarchaeota archaeon]
MRVYKLDSKKSNWLGSFSITTQLIILNIILFILSFIFIGIFGDNFFNNYLAINPVLILKGKTLWTFITSMFFHANFFHLFANMFSLYFIGRFLEKLLGKNRFLKVFIFSGILGSVFFILSSLIFGLNISAVGASGAIFGLLGVLAVLVPKSKIYLIVGPLILLILEFSLIPILPLNFANVLSSLINILFIVMIFSMFSFGTRFQKIAIPIKLQMWVLPFIAIIPLILIDLVPGIDLPIGNSAHIGGLIFGLIYGIYIKKKFPKKTRYISERFS